MKQLKFISVLLLMLILGIVGCDSTESNEETKQQSVESALTQLDATMGTIADAGASRLLMALAQMPDSLLDIDLFSPLLSTVSFNSFSKSIFSSNYNSTLEDTSLQNLLLLLESLYGTHTHDGENWNFVDDPADEVIIIYGFDDYNDLTTHTARFRAYGIDLTSNNAVASFEIYIDDQRLLWINFDIAGEDIFNEMNSSISSIAITGGMVDDSGIEVAFGITITDTNINIVVSVAGLTPLMISVSGTGLLQSITSDSEPPIESITISYGLVELVIDDFEAEEGDVGDVIYDGEKIGDLVVNEEGLFIEYNDGRTVNIAELMQNINGLMATLPQ